jgi:hypothetical protein
VVETKEWEFVPTGMGNFLLFSNDEDLYVSYNPDTGKSAIGIFCNDLIKSLSGKEYSEGQETCLASLGKRYILKGDFREEYLAIWPDRLKAMEIYQANKEQLRSDWSEDEE